MKKRVTFCVQVGILALVASLSGCSLCCAPYDYCGPVYSGGQCSNLARHRCGSAITTCGVSAGCATCQGGGVIQQGAAPVSRQVQPMQGNVSAGVPIPSAGPAPAPAPQQRVKPVVHQQQFMQPQLTQPQAPAPGVGVSVGADGYQKIQVFDESGTFLGYETIDATGRSLDHVPAPR